MSRPGVLLSFYLIFCQFQPGVAHKGLAYKKKRALGSEKCVNLTFLRFRHAIALSLSDRNVKVALL